MSDEWINNNGMDIFLPNVIKRNIVVASIQKLFALIVGVVDIIVCSM